MTTQSDAAVAGAESVHGGALPEWVVFACAGQRWGVPLTRVWRILPPQPVTRLPGSNGVVHGLIAVRGRLVTVVDAGASLGGAASGKAAEHRVVVLEHGAKRVGLLVDDVLGVARAAVTGNAELAAPGGEESTGTGVFDGEPFRVLDVGRVLARLEL